MSATSTEGAVLGMFHAQNKPFSVQQLCDFLAHAGEEEHGGRVWRRSGRE